MKNSSDDIYINQEYFKNNPDWHVSDAKLKVDILYSILLANKIQVKSIIEVGCGAGENLVELEKRDSNFTSLIGFDISPHAISLANKNKIDKVKFINGDLISMQNINADLMLIIDVIEHVDDFYNFLRKLKAKSKFFVLHVPLDLSCRTILKSHVLLQQRKSVGHIHYFSKEMVEWILEDLGYKIIDWVYTKNYIDINNPKTIKQFIKKSLRSISFKISRDFSSKMWGGYSMMILAK